MKKKYFLPLAFAGVVLGTTSAPVSSNELLNGFYFGGEFGSASVENRAQEIADEIVRRTGGTAVVSQTVRNGYGRIFGGVELNENIGVEVGYTQTRKFGLRATGLIDSTAYRFSGDVDVSGFDYSVILRPSVDSGFNDFFLRLGGHYLKTSGSGSASAAGISVSGSIPDESGSGLQFGVGYDWTFHENFDARVSVTRLNKVSGFSGNSATLVAVGILARF